MARNVWFKQRYVEPILRREKTDTYRRSTNLRRGDAVSLSVGPRTPFARARVEAVSYHQPNEIPEPRRSEVLAIFPDAGNEPLSRIRFELIE